MKGKTVTVVAASVVAAAAVIAILVVRSHRWRPRNIVIQGAVIRQDPDPLGQLPIRNVHIVATDGVIRTSTESDAVRLFPPCDFARASRPGQILQISFQKADYKPYVLTVPLHYRMALRTAVRGGIDAHSAGRTAAGRESHGDFQRPHPLYGQQRRRRKTSAARLRPSRVVNQANVPCNRQGPCSPDGNWKAAVGSITLDAGPGNEFRNVRASCIAGPCPFTRIDSSGFENGGRIITASALDWSSTATFLLEAEVFRKSIASNVRESYPVIFGRTLNFVLPGSQEGASIEAELDGHAHGLPARAGTLSELGRLLFPPQPR